MKSKLILLLVLLTFNHERLLFAIGENIKIDDYSYKDGLTTSTVFSVNKDSKGFLWICSANGLFRFDGYSFRNINTLIKDFLNLETYCITEDSDNNFLIGTSSGIYYYNTHSEKLFPLKLTIVSNCKIHQILLLDDKIWVASDNGLILIRKQKKFSSDNIIPSQLLMPDPLHKRTLQDNIINTIFYLPGNPSLWVGSNGALYELDQKKLVFHIINSSFQNSIRGISRYNNHMIASSWDGGVFLIDPSRHKMENDPFISEVNKIIGNVRIMSAIFDNQNHLWVASFNKGLYIFEKDKNGKVTFVNYRNDSRNQENLKSDFINQMYIDNTGIVWLCMNQPALSKVYFQKKNLHSFNFKRQGENLFSEEILGAIQSSDKNKLWVTTNGNGIYVFDVQNQNFTQYTDKTARGLQLQNNDINFCYQDLKGNLWIVYRKIGLYVVPSKFAIGLLDGTLKSNIKPEDANKLVTGNNIVNSYITTFYEDSFGRLWVGGWGSLHVIDLVTKPSGSNLEIKLSESKTTCVFAEGKIDGIDFPLSPVVSILEIKKNKYWIGTVGAGIIQIDELQKNKFSCKQMAINKKLPTNNVGLIYKDKKNGVWIGTHSGLCYWNLKTDSVKTITVKNGLSSDNINTIIEDRNSNIWLSTSYGISKIKIQDFTISNYFYTDKETFNQYIRNAGLLTNFGLVFSTNESLVIINPDSIENKQYAPPLYFTDIKIDNETVIPLKNYNGTSVIETNINECKTINVPYNHTLSIEFAALDFLAPERICYKYKIGKNNEWILLNPGQRNLTLPNMSHGEYTLSIMVANYADGNNIKSVRINYLPPFWLSKTAYAIYITFVLILFLTYRRLLIQKVHQKSIIEKERFEIKKLEELDKMKGEFFSNISHEFRTPLSLIINPLEKLVKEEDISNKNKEKIKLVLKSSGRLLKLTNEFMDFSKIEKNLLIPNFQLCDVRSFVNEICRLFNNLADSMNFDYNTFCSFELLEIPIDKGMIEKVIFNLLSNAFKYTPANGMIMVNLTKSKMEEVEYIKLSVINTGEGINNENLSKIFNRYYQVNNVQNRNIEGTGIGLSLVKSFVELHNGKVEVKSKPKLETCFDIYLPIHQEKFDETKDSLPATYGIEFRDTIPNQELKSQNIKPTFHYRLLIIEDDYDIRNYVLEELSSQFKILSAQNGEEGLKIANEIIPDLIITDVIMPVLSGLELCKKLKNQLITSHIPILMLSAKTTIEEQIEGLEMGADVYMIKPFSIDHLKAQILRLINFKQSIYFRYLKETALIPEGALNTTLDEEFMRKVTGFIEENLTNSDLCVDQLANCVSLSKVQTYRKIKAISGMSIVEFIRTIRLKKSVQMIFDGKFNFSEIAFETGFSTPSYFSKCFHDHFGKTPSEFASEYLDTNKSGI